MSYNYVVTAQKPTAVNGCVTGEAARAGDPAREGAGGNRGLGRPAAPGAAGRDRVPGMGGAGGRRSSPQPTTLKRSCLQHAPFGEQKLRSRVPFRPGRSLGLGDRGGPTGAESDV